jgi:hypothetical protein
MIASSATKLKVSDSSSKLYRSDISSISTGTFQAFPAITFLPLVTDIFLLHSVACTNIASAVPTTLRTTVHKTVLLQFKALYNRPSQPLPFQYKARHHADKNSIPNPLSLPIGNTNYLH